MEVKLIFKCSMGKLNKKKIKPKNLHVVNNKQISSQVVNDNNFY